MKIGLLTLTPAENYGGILQAVALYSYLSEGGHDVTLIRKVHYVPKWRKLISKLISALPVKTKWKLQANKRSAKIQRLKPFLDKYLPKQSGPIITPRDLKQLADA